MYFTSGSDRAFEQLMQQRPGADHFDSGDAGAPEDCGDCRFYRPDWKYQFCVYAECPYQPGKLTALDAVLFQVKGVDDEMAVFRVEKNRGYDKRPTHQGRPLLLFLGGVEGGVGEVDVLLVHLLLGQAHRLNYADRPEWKGTSC